MHTVKHLMLLLTCSFLMIQFGVAQNTIYVDDDAASGGDGSMGSPYQTIQEGIDNATSGDTIDVAEGTYVESVLVDKSVAVVGAPAHNTKIRPSSNCSGDGVTINSNNVSLVRLDIRDFNTGVELTGADQTTIDSVAMVDHCTFGFYVSGTSDDLEIVNSSINNTNNVGFRVNNSTSLTNVLISGSELNGNRIGVYLVHHPNSNTVVDSVYITNTTFNNNSQKGFYAEKLSNTIFDNVTVHSSGTDPNYGFNNGIDINLKWQDYENIAIQNSTITDCGYTGVASDSTNPAAIAIKARDDGGYGSPPATLDSVYLYNNTISGPINGVRFGEFGKVNASPMNIAMEQNDLSHDFEQYDVINNTDHNVTLVCNWHGTTNQSEIEDGLLNNGSASIQLVSYSEDVSFSNCSPLVLNMDTGEEFMTIQAAIDDADTDDGDLIKLSEWTFEENVTVNKSVSIQGAGMDQTTVYPAVSDIGAIGPPSFGNSQIFVIEADDVTLTQMTIDGDNPNLTSGAVINGADVDARNGVITNYTSGNYDNLVVHQARVQNIFLRAVYATGNGQGTVGNKFYDNQVNNADSVLVNSCGICLFNAKGEVWNNSFDKSNAWSQYSKGVSFHDNTITGGKYAGILSQNNGRFYPGPVDRDSIYNNTIQEAGFGLYVINPVVDTVFVQNNILTDNGYGISGTGSSSDTSRIVFENNTVSNSAGTAPSIGGEMDEWTGTANIILKSNTFSDLDTGLKVVSDHNEVINVIMDGDAFNNISDDYVHMEDTSSNGNVSDIDGSTVLFDGETIGPDNFEAIEMKVHHEVDDPNLGLFEPLPPCTGPDYVINATQESVYCSIQDAIDNATAGDTIELLAEEYEENVTVDKSLYIHGAGKDQTTVYPAVSNVGGPGGPAFQGSQVFVIESDHVTISDMTIDGDNPNLTSGANFNGADLDGRNGIITNPSVGNFEHLKVHDTRVQNFFLRGIYVVANGTGSFGHQMYSNEINNIDSVLVNSCGICLYNAGGEVQNNELNTANTWSQYSKGVTFKNNMITGGKYAGMLSQNNGFSFPGMVFEDSLINNTVQSTAFGIRIVNPGVDSVYVKNNVVSDNGYGIIAGGSTGDGHVVVENNDVSNSAMTAPSYGLYVEDWPGNAQVHFRNNTVSDVDTGLVIINHFGGDIDLWMDGDAFSSIPEDYVVMAYGGTGTIADIDGSTVLFDGETIGPDNNLTIEDKIYHAVDDPNLGLFKPLPYCPDVASASFGGGSTSFCFNDTANLTIDFLDTVDNDFEGNVTVEFTIDNANQGNYTPQPITLPAADWRSSGVDVPLDVTDILGSNSIVEAVITTDDNCQTALNESQIGNLLSNKDFTVYPSPQVASATFGGGASEFCYGRSPILTIDFEDNAGTDLTGNISVDFTIENTDYGTYDPLAINANASTWRSGGVLIPLDVPDILGENTITEATITTSNSCVTQLTETEISSILSNATFTVVPIEDIICPADIVVSCDESTDPQHTGMPTVDNCIDTFELSYSDVVVSGDCPQSDTIFRTWTVSDTTDYTLSCTQEITVVDDESPVMDCPDNNVDLFLDENGEISLTTNNLMISATDQCGSITYTISETVLDCSDLGLNDITVTAEDECGNQSNCVVTVDIQDNLPPMLSCPSGETLQAGGNCSANVPNYLDDITVSDNCGTITGTYQQPIAGTSLSPGVHDVTISAWDGNVNQATCIVTVTVEDDTDPNLTCPGPVTLQAMGCSIALPDYSDQDDVTDNCQTYVPLDQSPAPGTILSVGTHTVSITATDDYGNTSECTFEVSIQGETEPLTIECPQDDTLTAGANCQVSLPDYTGDAVVFDDCNSNVTITQEPAAGSTQGVGTLTVNLFASNDAGESDTCSLQVSILDQTAPTLSCPGIQTLSVNANCEAVVPDWTGGVVMDHCDNNPNVVQTPAPGSTLAPGTYTAELTATDDSGNSSSCTFNVAVIDDTNPTANCMDISITVQENTTYTLLPSEVDDGSFDNCSINSMSVTPNTFNCNDEGTQTVVLTVTDEAGNSSNCTASVTVECQVASLDFSGHIETMVDEPVDDVTVDVSGSSMASTTTDTAGDYSVTINDGSNVTLTPTRDINADEGISTADLITIQLHTLNIIPLSSPEQLIAADASNDGDISVNDIVTIQLVALNILDEFPNNESWRFVRSDYTFPNPMDPWEEPFPEDTTLVNSNADVTGLDFTAIKIGDVDHSYQQNIAGGTEQPQDRNGTYQLVVPDETLEYREDIVAWFYADEVEQLRGYQTSLEFMPVALDFQRIITDGDLEHITASNFNIQEAAEGKIHCNYMDATGQSHSEPLRAFGIEFKVKRKGAGRNLSQFISLSNEVLEPESYIAGSIYDLKLRFTDDRSNQIVLHDNRPNPFQDQTTVSFELPKDQRVQLKVFHSNGQLQYERTINASAGMNSHEISGRDWPDGLFYYQLKTEHETVVGKMLHQ